MFLGAKHVEQFREGLGTGRDRDLGGTSHPLQDQFVTIISEMKMHGSAVHHHKVDSRNIQVCHRALDQRQRRLHFLLPIEVDNGEAVDDQDDVLWRGLIEIINLDVAVHAWIDPTNSGSPFVKHVLLFDVAAAQFASVDVRWTYVPCRS